MNAAEELRVLLVEDDEDDLVILRGLLSEIPVQKFKLEWASNFAAGLEAMTRNEHDVCLVDYCLGGQNGVELLRVATEKGCQAPVILLTGAGEHQIDLQAMQAGAADYLVKGRLEPYSLERSIRYAVQRKRAAAMAAWEQARLAAFGAEVGLALARRDSLDAILERCTGAMLRFLNATLAQIEIFDSRACVFQPRAVSGGIQPPSLPLEHANYLRSRPASEAAPLVIKQLLGDQRVPDQDWVKGEGMVAYAGYPLVLDDKLVGLISIFARHQLSNQIIQEMGSVANGIALCIERKRSEEALDASEVKYRSVVENIKEVIFQLDEFGNWTFLNPAWTAVTGFEVQPSLGTFFIEYVHEEDRESNRHIFLQLLERKMDFCRYETRFLTKDAKVRWVEVYSRLTTKGNGAVAGASGSLTDITDRKQAETQIRRLAAFPQVNPNPVLEFAMDGTLTYTNDAALELARSLGKDDLVSILPANAGEIARSCLISGEKRLREEVHINDRTILWSFFPVAGSHVIHCYGSDVTDVLSLEAQFRHAQKLESVGQLAAGVAHDFNNILTVIQGYSDSLLSRCKGDPSTARALKQISDASKRAAALTRQLLTFSRKQVIQLKVLDLNSVLGNLANMLQRLVGEDVVLEADYAHDLPRIEADAGMVEQIVMNLAVNSRDAMPRGGRLMVSTVGVTIDPAYVSHHADARPGNFVCLTVSDTGTGMDRKTLDHIFEPFFSTKEVGKGTGLGLATVYGIVKHHQGWIEVASEVGVGTTFKIYLPAVDLVAEPGYEKSADGEGVRGGKETILLVEDEPVLRELVREVLSGYDYRVREASSGVEALRVWDECDGKIDLLLTDIVMPEGMTGRELAAELKRRKPGLKVVYSSGYSSDVDRDFTQGDTAFLPKPYHPPQLAQMVRQCLDAPRRQREFIAA